MQRSVSLTLKTSAALLALVILGASVLVWRLSVRPLSSTFMTPYIESAVDRYIPETHTEIADTLLTWNNIDHSIAFHANDIKIINKENDVIAEVPSVDIKLSAVGLIFGQFLPLSLSVEHPQIRLIREADGVLRFGGMSTGSGVVVEADNHTSMKATLSHIAYSLAHAHLTHRLEIKQLECNVQDEASQSSWLVQIPEISLERKDGKLSGYADVDVTQKDQTSTLAVHYEYDPVERLHNLDTTVQDITPSMFAGGHPGTLGLGLASVFDLPLSGHVSAAFDNELHLYGAKLEIHGDQGRINYPDFWDQPRAIDSLDMKAEFNGKEHRFEVPYINADFGGPQLKITAKGEHKALSKHDMDFDASLDLKNWPADQFAQLWPKPIIDNAREWIVASLSKGMFDHGEAGFKGAFSWDDLGNTELTQGEGKITASNMRVDYLEGMPPVDGVNTVATFDLTQMAAQITSGSIGNLKVTPFTIKMTQLDTDNEHIDIPLRMSGPIPDVLKLIDAPRLGYAKAIGLGVDDISGQVDGMVDLNFPLVKTLEMKDIDINATANLSNVASTKIVNGVDIAQGDLKMTLDKEGFALKGTAALNKIPAQVTLQQVYVEKPTKPLRQVSLSASLTGDQLETIGLGFLKGTRGTMPATLNLLQLTAMDKTTLSGDIDMTSAEAVISLLNWKKPAGTPATLRFKAEMMDGKDTKISLIDFSGQQISIRGDAVLAKKDSEIKELNLDPLILGRTNATVHFKEQNDDKRTLRYMVQGNSLDVEGIKGDKEPEHNDPRPKEYHIKVAKLYTSANGFIANAEGYAVRDPQDWNEINLRGLADGAHALTLNLVSKEDGHRVFVMSCDDFGKALKGLGLTDTVSGGKLSVHGASTIENPRLIDGEANIGPFTVSNLPALALLLNATSPFGFAGLLTSSADFSHLYGHFKWQGDKVELLDVRVAGNSVGLNIEGKVDLNSADANLNGTIVPFSMVNRMLGSIPLIGDILTGGSGGGVLALSYSITGTLDNPNISVNPVSLLTPGFIRNLFFGSPEPDDNELIDTPASSNPQIDAPVIPPAVTNFNKPPI
jgi:hypothetical protein